MIRINDLNKLHMLHQEEYTRIFQNVSLNSDFINGEKIAEFESEFADYIGVKEAIAVNSGTDALFIILKSLGLTSEEYVITVPNSFVATAHAISLCGATPLFCDVNPETGNICPESLKRLLKHNQNKMIKAIIPVHLWGQAIDWESIDMIAQEYHLPIIEDACQAHGAVYRQSQHVGGLGWAAAFSFYPGKNLGAFGDAGMICTNDRELAHFARSYRNNGRKKQYEHALIGCNSRMDSLQAHILQFKLQFLDDWNQKRRDIAQRYINGLKTIENIKIISSDLQSCVYHQFVIVVEQRDLLQKFLFKKQIETGIHYAIPLHLQPCYDDLDYHQGSFPNAEFLCKRILSLPMHPHLSNEEVDFVISAIADFYEK